MGHMFVTERSRFVPVADPAAMVELVMLFCPKSDVEMLKLLRESFPDRPLSARLAALAFLMRRHGGGAAYSPR